MPFAPEFDDVYATIRASVEGASRENPLRCFRLDESRNVDTGGVGLGLTIARDVARSHGGDMALAGSPMGGLRVVVRIPI